MSNGFANLLDDRIKRFRNDLTGDIERQNGFNEEIKKSLENLSDKMMTEEFDKMNEKLEQLSELLSVQADQLMKLNKVAMAELAVLKERNRTFGMKLGDCKSIVLVIVFGWIGFKWLIGDGDVLSALEAAAISQHM